MTATPPATRLLIITTNFPRWEGDPHSPWLVELLGLLRERGVEVEILAPAFRGQGSHTIHGMRVHRFRYAPAPWETLTHEEGAPSKIRRNPLYLLLLPLYLLAGMVAAGRLAWAKEYQVVHVHWPVPQGIFGVLARWAAGLAAWGSRRKPPRLVATFYGADLVLVQRFPFLRPFLGWFTRRCDDLAAISSYTRRELVRLAPAAPRTIPYGIALPPEDVQWPTEPGLILTVGRLIQRKGIRYLIQALGQLPAHLNARLVIVGQGPERPALEALAQELGLEERVTFAGRLPDPELERLYAACDVFVLPAIVDSSGDTEMLGMVLLEAMRYRKPVVASNVGGIPDIVAHGVNGLLTPQKDPQALAQAIERLLTDRKLSRRLGESGYNEARRRFSWQAVLEETFALYGLKPVPDKTH